MLADIEECAAKLRIKCLSSKLNNDNFASFHFSHFSFSQNKSFFIEEDGTALAGYDGLKKDYASGTAFEFAVKAGSEYTIIYNETFTVDGTTLQVTAGSAPSRIYVDNNRGQNLVTYTQYATLTFRAPEGKAITKIEFAAAGNSNINKFEASSGAIEGMIWTGNADGVRFMQGGTSYLANAIVTLADKDGATAPPSPLPSRTWSLLPEPSTTRSSKTIAGTSTGALAPTMPTTR